MDQFLLATHPLRPSEDQTCIVHMIDPLAIIQCLPGHVDFDQGCCCFFHYRGKNREMIKFTLHMLAFTPADDRVSVERERKLIRRAAHWYRGIRQEHQKTDV